LVLYISKICSTKQKFLGLSSHGILNINIDVDKLSPMGKTGLSPWNI